MPVYRVTVNDTTYTVEVPDPHARPVRAIVDGQPVEVEVAVPAPPAAPSRPASKEPARTPEPEPSQAQAPSPSPAATGGPDEVKAPLPGTVVTISVAEGDTVEPGQELCVLEAMKMNNPIRATQAGTVREIFVSVGEQVQHGVPLMVIEG